MLRLMDLIKYPAPCSLNDPVNIFFQLIRAQTDGGGGHL